MQVAADHLTMETLGRIKPRGGVKIVLCLRLDSFPFVVGFYVGSQGLVRSRLLSITSQS